MVLMARILPQILRGKVIHPEQMPGSNPSPRSPRHRERSTPDERPVNRRDPALSTGFAQLGTICSEIARGLIDLGIAPGDKVALLCTTRPEWSYVDLAISAAGGVVVPIYPTNSAEDNGCGLDTVVVGPGAGVAAVVSPPLDATAIVMPVATTASPPPAATSNALRRDRGGEATGAATGAGGGGGGSNGCRSSRVPERGACAGTARSGWVSSSGAVAMPGHSSCVVSISGTRLLRSRMNQRLNNHALPNTQITKKQR